MDLNPLSKPNKIVKKLLVTRVLDRCRTQLFYLKYDILDRMQLLQLVQIVTKDVARKYHCRWENPAEFSSEFMKNFSSLFMLLSLTSGWTC